MSSGATDTAPGAGLAYGESAARWVLAATVLGSSLTFVGPPRFGADTDETGTAWPGTTRW
jgi:hypothetical protein